MKTATETPRVYIACLASYNNGILHGRWVDAVDSDAIREGIAEVLKTSTIHGAEEWAFHDYDGFGKIHMGEYEDVDTIALHGRMIKEHGDAWIGYANNVGADSATKDGFEEAYQGEYDSIRDYAEQYLSDTGELESIPEHLRGYFDYDSYARDLELNGDIYEITIDGRCYIYLNI